MGGDKVMASNYRSPSILINEAKILASAPDTVAAWLAKSGEFSHWSKDADANLEVNLLARNERLIDLALAEYGFSDEVLRELFNRDDEVIRAAVLSNKRILGSKTAYGLWIEHWQFIKVGPDFSWMAELSDVEADALFSNPSLPAAFIMDFFERGGAWEKFDDDQRFRAASNIIKTIKTRQHSSAPINRLKIDYKDELLLRAAWRFSNVAPVEYHWAYALGDLYSELQPIYFSDFDPLSAATRWHLPGTDTEELDAEKQDNQNGYLSTFQMVRSGLARAASRASRYRRQILNNSDVAIRCGGYSILGLSVKEMEAAVALDGKLACGYLVQNESVWKRKTLRSALEDICHKASQDDYSIGSPRSEFNQEELRLRQLHPEWFGDKGVFGIPVGDKPVSDSSIREIAESVVKSREFLLMKNLIADQSKDMWWRFGIILAVLVVIGSKL